MITPFTYSLQFTNVSGGIHNRISGFNAYNMKVSDRSFSPVKVMKEMNEQSGNGEELEESLQRQCRRTQLGKPKKDHAANTHGGSQIRSRENVCMMEDEKVLGP